jgi:uncharacterized protein (TIGR02268 family)
VAGSQAEPAPEIHALLGVTTVILFDADIVPASVQVDPTRIRILDVGVRSILFVPLLELGSNERLGLGVRYADGASPGEARFAIVSRPPTVDTVLSVLRRPQPLAECQAELAQARLKTGNTEAPLWSVVNRLAGGSVEKGVIATKRSAELQIDRLDSHAYRFKTGLLITIRVRSRPDQPSWVPVRATLKSQKASTPALDAPLTVRKVDAAPAGGFEVAVEAGLPLPVGERYTLELRGAGGQTAVLELRFDPSSPKEVAR